MSDKSRKRHRFKQKVVLLDFIPRIDVCNLCRAVVPFDTCRTILHHEEYDENDSLRYTIEVCQECHNKETWKRQEYRFYLEKKECYACGTHESTTSWVYNGKTGLVICQRCRPLLRRPNDRKRWFLTGNEECYACGSKTTTHTTVRGKKYPCWHRNGLTGLFICGKCSHSIFYS